MTYVKTRRIPIGKRLFDIIFASAVLLATLPVWVFVAIAIKLDDGGDVFFQQPRVGRRGVVFHMWKFRTMVPQAQKQGGGLTRKSDSRITRVGEVLRKYKIDEVPQFINVLNGSMSVVGPRPEVPQFVVHYSADQKRVLNYVPGITDPASIAYRNESELLASADEGEKLYIEEIMPEKIRINLCYAAAATFWSDMKVILGTALVAVRP